jgi:two-component system chemotaxis sensor kinase CheA
VGLDVVKKNVEALRGSVEVNSQKGEGTTITLKLPLTLAIIEGLLVDIAEDKFVVPLSFVEECVELTKEETEKMNGRDILNVRGEIVPYVRLRKLFMIEGESPESEHVVITRINGDRIGFVVDQVIGSHQTVIKPLGQGMKSSQEISGATILGDGTVALILDVDKII